MERRNSCGKSNKKWCRTSTTAWVWELVAIKLIEDLSAWAWAEPPYRFQLAFSHDGIVFLEEGDLGKFYRCVKYEDFMPSSHMDWQMPDPFTDNQWTRDEMTIGPKNVVPPIINSSNSYIPTYDASGRGVVCFYDKLWFANGITYINSEGDKSYNYIDFSYELIFQPVQMQRMDYIEHLINRTRCGNNKCWPQPASVVELECIGDCYFKSADEYGDGDKIKLSGSHNKDGTIHAFEVTGKQAKNRKEGKDPCFDVCTVGDNCCSKLKTALEELAKVKKERDQFTKLYLNFYKVTGCPDAPPFGSRPQIQKLFEQMFWTMENELLKYPSINPEFAAYMREELVEWKREKPDFSTLAGMRWVELRIDRYLKVADSTGTHLISIIGLCYTFIILNCTNNCPRIAQLFNLDIVGERATSLLKAWSPYIKGTSFGPPNFIRTYKAYECLTSSQSSSKGSEKKQAQASEAQQEETLSQGMQEESGVFSDHQSQESQENSQKATQEGQENQESQEKINDGFKVPAPPAGDGTNDEDSLPSSQMDTGN